jgi:hypothetical protein
MRTGEIFVSSVLGNFDGVSRVKVVNGPLAGKFGSVQRVLISDPKQAWIRMEEDIPDEIRSFGKDDTRGNDVRIHCEDCEAVRPVWGGKAKKRK